MKSQVKSPIHSSHYNFLYVFKRIGENEVELERARQNLVAQTSIPGSWCSMYISMYCGVRGPPKVETFHRYWFPVKQ